ncbi:MAG: hypothetical protein HQ553_03670 [Chloroflexi bacterium]|nr:hypothetical protein [Chloroflexota bacterium]
MSDYSMVRDKSGNVNGLWLRDPEAAQNRDLLSFLLIDESLPDELIAAVLAGSYRVVPNTFDNAGGCFVIFGSAPAPGEKTAPAPRQKMPKRSVEATQKMPKRSVEATQKKWWQFWK